jgi:hypothetical protein
MNVRKLFAALALTVVIGSVFLNSCKKNNPSEPLEPISLVKPDTLITTNFAGDSVPVEIKFTTDRPINWILGLCDVDTMIDSTNYTATYPDTIFLQDLTKLSPRENLYTYSTTYHVPDSLIPFSVLRFKISFQAGDASPVYGQNYPVGVVTATKEFVINIR